MNQSTRVPAARAPDDAVRLKLDPDPGRTTILDGAWWPRSTNALDEIPRLVGALSGRRGEITHVLLNTTEWDLPHPRRAGSGRRAVRLGWYTSQPPGLITVISDFGADRFDLLVVPPGTGQDAADAAASAAADSADRRHTPELIAEMAAAG